jgi:hypothetical protein
MYVLFYSIIVLETLYLTKQTFEKFEIFTLYLQRKSYDVGNPHESGGVDVDVGVEGRYFLYTGIYRLDLGMSRLFIFQIYEWVVYCSLQYINGWRYINRSIIFLQDTASLLRVEVAAVSRNRYRVEKTVDTHKILINAIKFYVCLQEI